MGLFAHPRHLQPEDGPAPRHVRVLRGAGEEEEGLRVPSEGIRALA